MKIIHRSTFIFLFSLFFTGACTKLPSSPNVPPVANAGTNISSSVDLTSVLLNGSGSSVTGGNSLTYSWSVISTIGITSVALFNQTSVTPVLSMTGFDVPGDSVSIQLIVNDGKDSSLPSIVIIERVATTTTTATATPNTPPVADAGIDISSSSDLTAVILNGSGSSDADVDDLLTYSWSITASIGVTLPILANQTSVTPTLSMTGFDTLGDSVSVQLIVNDGKDSSLPAVVIISHT